MPLVGKQIDRSGGRIEDAWPARGARFEQYALVPDVRWRRIATVGAALSVMLFLAGCSPLDQGAVTLDEDSRLPKLVLTFWREKESRRFD
jgi:hypothetical protein